MGHSFKNLVNKKKKCNRLLFTIQSNNALILRYNNIFVYLENFLNNFLLLANQRIPLQLRLHRQFETRDSGIGVKSR